MFTMVPDFPPDNHYFFGGSLQPMPNLKFEIRMVFCLFVRFAAAGEVKVVAAQTQVFES
jgi:hypothetical protein